MRAPDGTIITAFDLNDCQDVSLIKYDLLSVEALDKIHICLDLLIEQGFIEYNGNLKETYENVVGVYNLERNAKDMWEMVWEHKIQSLFQMEKQSGIRGIALTKPESVDDLATLNSVIRLMAQEKGAEQPLNKFARFKKDIRLWYDEMEHYGLTQEEQKILEPIIKISYGICESQEGFMQLVQMPECGGFDLTWADRLRKSIAKKNPKEFDQLTKEYFENCEQKHLSKNLCKYVWKVMVAYSRGYSFNKSHTLAYSLVALQEMNLAFKYPIMFWNCACLISDAGGNDETEIDEEAEEELKIEETYSNEMEEFNEEEDEAEDSYEEDCAGYPAEVIKTAEGKKKKKVKTSNYGKIASAIGKISSTGVKVSAPDINESKYTFSPDIANNTIRYGLNGITRIGEDLIKTIIINRPYSGIDDFLKKVKINKPQMVNLIKAGAFDRFGDRFTIMKDYIMSVSDCKKRVTLQNMKMLIDFGLIPDEYDLQRRVYNFNKYLKKLKEDNNYYGLDNIAFDFYSNNFDMDLLEPSESSESQLKIKQVKWDNIYQHHMDIIRPYIKSHNVELLNAINDRLISDMWNKYCTGSISKWEMDATSCYIHEHELNELIYDACELDRFGDLSTEPQIDRYIPIKGKMIPIFKLNRIAGTVIDKDKNKNTVTLLTPNGVVVVKVWKSQFSAWDKQISEKDSDGKKHVIEKSWFTRGNKLIITGIKRDNTFIPKKYKGTEWPLFEKIEEIDDKGFILSSSTERVEVE